MDLIADPDEVRDLTAEQHPDRARMMEVLADALIVAHDAGRGASTQSGHVAGLA